MIKISYTLCCLLLCAAFHCGATNNIMYEKANQLYHNKNYDSAARLYQQMINDGYCSSDLFYNTGNAYYRLNKIGLSIWCYEKALQIHNNKNYLENLALAKKRISEPIDEISDIFFIRWWKGLYNCFSLNTWSILALTCFLLAFLILFLRKLKPTLRFSPRLIGILIALSSYCLLMLCVSSYNKTYHYKAIIVEPKTLLTFTSKREPIFVSEGIKVEVVDEHGKDNSNEANYVLVKLPDGRIGKLDRRSFKKL